MIATAAYIALLAFDYKKRAETVKRSVHDEAFKMSYNEAVI